MTKQEFLAIGLNNGLKVRLSDDAIRDFWDSERDNGNLQNTFTINCIYENGFIELIDHTGYSVDVPVDNLDYITIIARPLSDLTKPIEQDGERFVSAINMGGYYSDYPNEIEHDIESGCISLADALQLIKWHFDIVGLIEKGEAIDVNTLNENPYK